MEIGNSFKYRAGVKRKSMPQSPKDVFYLVSDLADAIADLSIAMRAWYVEQENSLLDVDNDSISALIHTTQSVLEKMKRS
jgi:hypothetical protein